MELGTLLQDLSSRTADEFKTMPEVVEAGNDIDVATLPIEARRWTRISDVVAVVADLKSSTQLGTGSKAASTASIYEAGTGGVVRIAAAKYRWINLSIVSSFFGVAALAVTAFYAKYYP